MDARAGGGGRKPRPADGRCLAAAPRGRHADPARREPRSRGAAEPLPSTLRSAVPQGSPSARRPSPRRRPSLVCKHKRKRRCTESGAFRGVPIPGGGLCSAELPFTGKDRWEFLKWSTRIFTSSLKHLGSETGNTSTLRRHFHDGCGILWLSRRVDFFRNEDWDLTKRLEAGPVASRAADRNESRYWRSRWSKCRAWPEHEKLLLGRGP